MAAILPTQLEMSAIERILADHKVAVPVAIIGFRGATGTRWVGRVPTTVASTMMHY